MGTKHKYIIFRCKKHKMIFKWGKWVFPKKEDLKELIINNSRINYIEKPCDLCIEEKGVLC